MLHQLLFALLGKPGSLIIKDEKGFKVNRSYTMVKQSQMALINRIVDVGYLYGLLSDFITSETLLVDYSNGMKKLPSVYRKAFAFGLENALVEYKELILGIQSTYLKNKHFTIANIQSQLVKYQLLFPDLLELLNHINDHLLKGGAIIDLLYQKYLNSNIWLRAVLQIILKECYQVMINQISSWILYGEIIDKNGEFFIHRVSFQPTHKFRFSNTNVKQIEITDWEMYTIQASMIPKSFLKESTAGKILFIGKSSKILRNCQKLSSLPSEQFLEKVRKISENQFSSNSLEETIEDIRQVIAQKMISLIMDEEKFLKQFEKVNEYFLMTKGDFYQLLLQECKGIERIPQKQKVQKKINQIYLQNTFMRLNCMEDSKKIRFELKQLGFIFNGFKSFNQLCPVGSIDLLDGKSIKFNNSDGALWHKSKQLIENDFVIGFVLKFKKYPTFFKTEMKNFERTPAKAGMSIIFQNSQEIVPNSHENPSNVRSLDEYLSIDFGFISNEKQTEFSSFLKIVAFDSKKNNKPVLLGTLQLKKINFNDENPYHVKISYKENNRDKNLKVAVGIPNIPQSYQLNELNIDLSFPYYVNLEMGRANLGFISNLIKSSFCAEIEQWEMICTALNHYGDHWSDLGLSFKTSWPLDLVLTLDLFDHFSRVHKFLFPIRQTQIQLEQMWLKIPRRIKQQRYYTEFEKNQMITFQRRLSTFRSKISLIMNQLWKYFQADVIESTWFKLKSALQKTDDFQYLIKMVNKYIKSIQTMLFFNLPKIQRIIHQIIRQGKDFLNFFMKIEREDIDEDCFAKLEQIKDGFDDTFRDLLSLLRELSKINSSSHLYHFTQRMEASTYMQKGDYLRSM